MSCFFGFSFIKLNFHNFIGYMHVVYNYDVYWIQLYETDGRSWFFPGTPVSSTNNTECHDITEILLKVTLNTK